jgi:NDP-sugar pyrophosphorylase family protein
MKVIILAGGQATRLPISAKNIPKSLVKIAGQPILEHRLEWLKKHGLEDILFSLGYLNEKIIKYLNGRYEYVVEKEPLGTGGAFKFASQDLQEDFMAMNGDELADINLTKFIRFHKTHSLANSIVGRQYPDVRGWGWIKNNGIQVEKFIEKPDITKTSGLINTGLYILSPKIFKTIKARKFSIERDLFPKLVQQKQFAVFACRCKWLGINTEEDVKRANQTWR